MQHNIKKKVKIMATICKCKNGKWCAAVVIGTKVNGKPNRKYLYGNTKKEVEAKLRHLTTDLHMNGSAIDNSKITLGEWTCKHLFTNLKNSISKSTFDTYMRVYDVHIRRSGIGEIDLKNIKTITMQEYFNAKTDLSNEYLKKIYNVLNSSFKGAIANNLIRINPLDAVKLPISARKEKGIDVLTREEQRAYVLAAENEYYGLVCITALFCGLRLGEVKALRWENVNLRKGEIIVAESAKRVRVFTSADKFKTNNVVKEPKTKSGIRKIPIPSFLLAKLKEHKIGTNYSKDEDKVFCTKTGNFLGENNIRRSHYRICTRANIQDITFHALRHTFATRMVESGIDYKTLQELMGHSDIKVTMNRYAHVLDETKREAIQKQEQLYRELLL